MNSNLLSKTYEVATSFREVEVVQTDFAPNSVWTFTVPNSIELNQELEKMIADKRSSSPTSRKCAGREMWQSSENVTYESPVQQLFSSVLNVAQSIANSLDWDTSNLTPRVTISWANAHPPGAYHTRHIHPADTHISGVYYIKTSPDCGNIVFHDLPRFLGLWGTIPKKRKTTSYNTPTHSVTPEDGLCVLFPGYLMHEVETNKSDTDRLGIAFNIKFE